MKRIFFAMAFLSILFLLGCVEEENTTVTSITIPVTLPDVTSTTLKQDTNNNGDVEQNEFCGNSTYGPCTADEDCMTGGCSNEVCQSKSEELVVTACEYRECYNAETYGLSCGCVDSQCQWH